MSRRHFMRMPCSIIAAMLLLLVTACAPAASSNAVSTPVASPKVDMPLASHAGNATAVLAGGCFWGLQWVFEHVPGVTNVTSGYSGGAATTATYERVSESDTGHAETVRIAYDPSKVTYGQLLRVYFSVATNPTELNRQGPDTGSQYRGVIFYANAEQEKIAKDYVAQLGAAHAFAAPIVTQIVPFKTFYPAEVYHQDYARLNPGSPYIAINDAPKVVALQRELPALYNAQPVIWHADHPTTIMVDVH